MANTFKDFGKGMGKWEDFDKGLLDFGKKVRAYMYLLFEKNKDEEDLDFVVMDIPLEGVKVEVEEAYMY